MALTLVLFVSLLVLRIEGRQELRTVGLKASPDWHQQCGLVIPYVQFSFPFLQGIHRLLHGGKLDVRISGKAQRQTHTTQSSWHKDRGDKHITALVLNISNNQPVDAG